MAVTAGFLLTCEGLVAALPELTTFRSAQSAFDNASELDRVTRWIAAFGEAQLSGSPALRLRKAIREVVVSQSDGLTTMNAADKESAYATLATKFVPAPQRPSSQEEQDAEVLPLILNELITP